MPGMASPMAHYAAGVKLLSLIHAEIHDKALAATLVQATEALLQEASCPGAQHAPPGRSQAQQAAPSAAVEAGRPAPAAFLEGVQLLAPRGKFDVGFSNEALVLRNRQANHNSAEVAWPLLEHVVVLDAVPNAKDGSKALVAVVAKRGAHIMHGKTKLQVLVLQVSPQQSFSVPAPSAVAELAGADGMVAGPALVVLCQLLGALLPDAGAHTFLGSDAEVFSSSSGKPFIEANIKAQPGHLYPLPGALLYVGKPALFLRTADVTGLQLLRATGGSSTFDLCVTTAPAPHGSGAVELGQIPYEELPRLQAYLASQRIKSAGASQPGGPDMAAAATGGPVGKLEDEGEDEDEDEDDSDFDPDAAPVGKRRRLDEMGLEELGGQQQQQQEAEDEDAQEDAEEEEGEEGEEGEEDEDEDDDSDEESLVDSDEVHGED